MITASVLKGLSEYRDLLDYLGKKIVEAVLR